MIAQSNWKEGCQKESRSDIHALAKVKACGQVTGQARWGQDFSQDHCPIKLSKKKGINKQKEREIEKIIIMSYNIN